MNRKNIVRSILTGACDVLLIVAGSCRRASHNGAIDGNWKILTIETLATGEVTDYSRSQVFIAINLELMQLRSGTFGSYTGIIDYDKGDHRLAVEFPDINGADQLRPYGIDENPVVFTVEKANSKRLRLRTSTKLITCRRF